jgi:hypothetical protein
MAASDFETKSGRDLSRGYLPIVLACTIVFFVAAGVGTASYTLGGVVKSIEYDRRETTVRFGQLEAAIAKIQAILESRQQCPGPNNQQAQK